MELRKLVSSNEVLELNSYGRAVGILQSQISEIRDLKMNWSSYWQGLFIKTDHYQFIMKYDHTTNSSERDLLIKENPHNTARVFIHLLNKMETEQTIQYLLTVIDDMIQEDKKRVEIFSDYFIKLKDSMMDYFFCFLRRENKFIVYQASRIIVKLLCWSSYEIDQKDLQYFLQWIQEELQFKQDNEYIDTVARDLQMIVRIRSYRIVFVKCNGIESIIEMLSGELNSQIQYQMIFCLWCLSFDADIVQRMSKTTHLISTVSEIIRRTEREKIVRISLAFFRFLIEKLDSQSKVRELALAMVQCKVLKQLELLQQKDYSHDPELTEDMSFLIETLSSNVHDVSSLEEYSIELKSGRLEWSPVHKAEKFWRQNTDKFLDRNYELLKMLVRLLETSKEVVTLQVAIHDIGEFVRHNPRGKQIIDKVGGKGLVINFLDHSDATIKYHALICLQKIMVHNWEFLGKQVDQHKDQSVS